MIRLGTPDDDAFLATAFVQMWLDIGYPPERIITDAESRTRAFIDDARARLDFRSAIAERDGARVGCAASQLFAGLYPAVLDPAHRQYGYVWGVYVDPAHRRAGMGRQLTQRCVDALRDTGCTDVILHAAPMGVGVYERLGFRRTQEMKLTLG